MAIRASVLLGAGIGVAALSGFALAEPLGISSPDVKEAPTPTQQWIYGSLVPALVQIAEGGNATVQLAQAAKQGIEYSIAGLELPEWVGRFEVEVDLTAVESGDNNKPEFSILTVQPLFQEDDKSETYFAQLQLNYGYQFGDTRLWTNAGVGYRRIIDNNMLIGLNTFLDYDFEEQHLRASVGGEFKFDSVYISANAYVPLTDEKTATSTRTEEALAGYDLEARSSLPYLPWARAGLRYFT